MINSSWAVPPAQVQLSAGEVHLWVAGLDSETAFRCLAGTLSVPERDRAQGLVFEKHRRRSIVARGVLRNILERYLGEPASAIELKSTAEGKPGLAGRFAASGLRFNLSHSGDCAVYAVTRVGEVGVDIEKVC